MISSRFTTRNLSNLFFLLVIFFLPQQFGPHFWPNFAFVNGIRVDYLSPTFYLSDLFIVLLFLTSFRAVFSTKISKQFLGSKLFLLFFLILLIPLFYAPAPLSLFYGICKFIEFLFFALYIVTRLDKKTLGWAIDIFILNGVLESLLALIQFFKQSSIGNVLYFVGERTFDTATVGIATMTFSGTQLLRPYGTFPHPNILAFFLFTASVLGVYALQTMKRSGSRTIYIASFVIIQATLFLTFSRVIIFCDVLFLAYRFLYLPIISQTKVTKTKIVISSITLLSLLLYFSLYYSRFIDSNQILNSLFPRLDLIQISCQIILSHPLFGVGLQQFFYSESIFQTHFTAVYLQPVHNVYLYVFAQIGLVGGAIFMFFIKNALVSLRKKLQGKDRTFSFYRALLVLVLAVLFTGLFDHFFLTTQQGELLFAVILGLTFVRAKS